MTGKGAVNGEGVPANWTMVHGDCTGESGLSAYAAKSFDHVITDPPYSEHVHAQSLRGKGADHLPRASNGKVYDASFARKHEFGFVSLASELRLDVAAEFGRLAKRWVLVFSDVEGCGLWRRDLKKAGGLEYVRTLAWVKLAAAPQFTGDRPAPGFEAMTLAHPKGRKRWNGGGKAGVYSARVVQNTRGADEVRVHTAQKPLELMLDLVRDFTDEGDLMLDPFAGSATTGVACLRLGRRFLGIEQDEKWFGVAVERLRAEERGLTLGQFRREARSKMKQTKLFG